MGQIIFMESIVFRDSSISCSPATMLRRTDSCDGAINVCAWTVEILCIFEHTLKKKKKRRKRKKKISD